MFIASDVFWPKDDTLRRQLVYVAVSRARKAVWLVGEKSDLSIKEAWENRLGYFKQDNL